MLTVVTTRPPSTYIFIPSLQFNVILEKLYFCCLMLKATKFFWCWILKFLFATSVVGATGGSWLKGAYVLTSLPTNKARIRRKRRSLEDQDQNMFQSSLLFSISFFLARRKKGWRFLNLPKVIQKKKKKKQPVAATRNAVATRAAATCSVVATRAVAMWSATTP
jgi:hypothetical protein